MTLSHEDVLQRIKQDPTAAASMLVRLRLQTLDKLFVSSLQWRGYGSVDDRILAALENLKRRDETIVRREAECDRLRALVPEEQQRVWGSSPPAVAKPRRHPRS